MALAKPLPAGEAPEVEGSHGSRAPRFSTRILRIHLYRRGSGRGLHLSDRLGTSVTYSPIARISLLPPIVPHYLRLLAKLLLESKCFDYVRAREESLRISHAKLSQYANPLFSRFDLPIQNRINQPVIVIVGIPRLPRFQCGRLAFDEKPPDQEEDDYCLRRIVYQTPNYGRTDVEYGLDITRQLAQLLRMTPALSRRRGR